MRSVTSSAGSQPRSARVPEGHPDASRPALVPSPSRSFFANALPPETKLFVPRLLRPVPSIAGLASQAAAAGLAPEAELLFRHAFARGESGPEIDRSIRRQTARLLAKGLQLCVTSITPRAVERDIPVRNAAELIRILRDELGTRLTLMDLCELMDVGSPRIRLEGLLLECEPERDGISSIGITGRYDLRRLERGWCRYECYFELDRGVPAPLARSIRVSELIKGSGIGARSLLALALFCARHGVPGWGERVQDDGIFAWRRLGGRLNPEGLHNARELLEALSESGAVFGLGLHGIDWSDPESIATVRVLPGQLRDRETFDRWLERRLRLCSTEIGALPRPYPVGYLALRASPLYAGYVAAEILKHLVQRYFPRRIAEGGGAAMAEALSAAERERDLLMLSENAFARHLASGLLAARAEARNAMPAVFAPTAGPGAPAQVFAGRGAPASSWVPRPAAPLYALSVATLLPRLFALRAR